jgi:predicted  nucleic acid-binding Zn-ribbon protein
MIDPLEELVPRAERARAELNQLLEQLEAEREAVKAATIEAHEAVQGLRSAVREAKEEMRQSSKAEARKHLARQMRAAADILARDS